MFEIALHVLKQQRSIDRLLELMLINEEHLLPLISSVLVDPSSHLQILGVALNILLVTFKPIPLANARGFATELKRSGTPHMLMLQCARMADPALEAEHLHRDGVAPRTILPVATELLATILARCEDQRPWEPDQPSEWQAAFQQHLRHCQLHASLLRSKHKAARRQSPLFIPCSRLCLPLLLDEWSAVCKDASTAIAAGALDSADLHLSLLAHWLESFQASPLCGTSPSLLDSSCVTSMLDRMLAKSDPSLRKPQLLRMCQLLMVSSRKQLRQKSSCSVIAIKLLLNHSLLCALCCIFASVVRASLRHHHRAEEPARAVRQLQTTAAAPA